MPRDETITSIRFRNFKAFHLYSLSLRNVNVLVGPNNSGKSTILSAFRVLSAAIRGARRRSPSLCDLPGGDKFAYRVPEEVIPMSVENVHTDYDDVTSSVDFRVSNGNHLKLLFTTDGECYLIPESSRGVRTPSDFRRSFPLTIGVVPVLGPLEHEEPIVERETVNRSAQTHRASRHFRNYWRYNPEGFDAFADLVSRTWPGMRVYPPEKPDMLANTLQMMCRENALTGELYWAGFGFQVWCQLLTHIFRASDDALIVIDEPEIYLHPDVQRQMLSILRDLGPDVLIATHSTEVMTEADPTEIILVDKTRKAGRRLKDVAGVQQALDAVGSVQNITLTRLARNRRVLFVEGDSDFTVLRRFARRCGMQALSSGADITAVESGGFSSWERIKGLAWGMGRAFGKPMMLAAVFDRDFWCDERVAQMLAELAEHLAFAHIHSRKEIENYLLVPAAIDRALATATADRARRGGRCAPLEPAHDLLGQLTEPHRGRLQAQYLARRNEFLRPAGRDAATVHTETIEWFESKWNSIETRMEIVAGKEILRLLREEVSQRWKVSLTDARIVDAFPLDAMPADLRELLDGLERFRSG